MAEDQEFTLPPLEERPLVTFALFAYNQEKYIREAVESALHQTYQPLEIILSDDCSTDSTFDVLKDVINGYAGPHKIIVNRNPVNMGVTNHVNKIFHLSGGDLVIAAAGDDISKTDRAERLTRKWAAHNFCTGAIYSPWIPIDSNGLQSGPPQSNKLRIAKFEAEDKGEHEYHGLIQGACAAWTRNLITTYGDLCKDALCEDLELSYRAAFCGSILFVDEPLVYYRIAENSVSNFSKNKNIDKTIQWQKSRLKSLSSLSDFIENNIHTPNKTPIKKSINRLSVKYRRLIKLNQIKAFYLRLLRS